MPKGNRPQHKLQTQKDIIEKYIDTNWDSRDTYGFYTKIHRHLTSTLSNLKDVPLSYPSTMSYAKEYIESRNNKTTIDNNDTDEQKTSKLLLEQDYAFEKFEQELKQNLETFNTICIDLDKNLDSISKNLYEIGYINKEKYESKKSDRKSEIMNKVDEHIKNINESLFIHLNKNKYEQYDAKSELNVVNKLKELNVAHKKCDKTFDFSNQSYTPDIIVYKTNGEEIYLDPSAPVWIQQKLSNGLMSDIQCKNIYINTEDKVIEFIEELFSKNELKILN